MRYVASLDGLRGAAVLFVVFFHYFPRAGTGPLGFLASAGWMGVDIFFVLSGYLITRILYEQRGAEHYFRNFYMRRVLRLFPGYYSLFFFSYC
jgi:peptidoglycan/LPS O-acetylase OafA/YrhL